MSQHEDVAAIAAKIKLLILDVDGVLTDGRFLLEPKGEEYKPFHSQDGQGLRSILDQGIEVGIITGRSSAALQTRADDLGIPYVYQGKREKVGALQDMLAQAKVDAQECAYVGDDWPDIAVMHRIGLPIAVQNAREETKQAARYITPNRGGHGAVRDVCDLLLKSQGRLAAALAKYV